MLDLTPKEQFVARQVALGHTNKEISVMLGTSEQYVKLLLVKVYNKTGMFNRSELVIFMLENNHVTLPKKPKPDLSKLTPQELNVAMLAKEGYTTKDTAQKLEIDPITVRRHLSRIYTKLGIKSRSQLVAILVYNATHEASPAGVYPQKGT